MNIPFKTLRPGASRLHFMAPELIYEAAAVLLEEIPDSTESSATIRNEVIRNEVIRNEVITELMKS